MKLKKYIQGKRHGKKAHDLEREALENPFLQDALDGFDAVEGDHVKAIEELGKEIKKRSRPEKQSYFLIHYVRIAASVLVLIGIGSFFYFQLGPSKRKPQQIAKTTLTEQKSVSDNTLTDSSSYKITHDQTIKFTSPEITAGDLTVYDYTDECSEIMAFQDVMVDSRTLDTEPSVKEMYDSAYKNDLSMMKTEEMNHPSEKIHTLVQAERVKSTEPSADMLKKSKKESVSSLEETSFFGEHEFKIYFEKNKKKELCSGEKADITIQFSIDKTGTPYKMKVVKCNCQELQDECIRLLEKGPKWTTEKEKIQLYFEIN